MDSFKKPEMIIAIIVLIAVIAVTVYFYRKMGTQQEEINKYGERLASVVKKIGEMPQQAHISQLVEGIKARDDRINEQAKIVESLSEEVEELRYLVDVMTDHMNEMGYKVRLPRRRKTTSLKGKKGVSFRSKKESESEEDSDNEIRTIDNDDSDEETSRGKNKEEDNLEKKIALARAHRQGR